MKRAVALFVGAFALLLSLAALPAWGADAASAAAATPAAGAARPVVHYDASSDKLSVEAKDVSLKGLLARIGLVSSVDMRMDPAVERKVTVTIKDQPLERGLTQLARNLNLNYMMVYGKRKGAKKDAKPMVIGMNVLRAGQANDSNLQPLLNPQGEAFFHAMGRGGKQPSILTYAQQRWQERLARMPQADRERLEAQAEKQAKAAEARRAEQKKRREKFQKMRERRQAQRKARMEQMKKTDPAVYDAIMKRNAEARAQFKQQLEEKKQQQQGAQ